MTATLFARLGFNGTPPVEVSSPAGSDIAIATDTLVEGVHFPTDTAPEDVGHKTLAVNLSDLAAMGATPWTFSIAIAWPGRDEAWLERFGVGLGALAARCGVKPQAGCESDGPLTVTIQVLGHVPEGKALRRAGAAPGDLIYVTGTLGDAGAGLALHQTRDQTANAARDYLRQRLARPEPRIAAGTALRGIASAAIDISDGLLADLGHIAEASGVGAVVRLHDLPLSTALTRTVSAERSVELALSAGDDYELCFCMPAAQSALLESRAPDVGCTIACIGVIDEGPGVRCLDSDGAEIRGINSGYQHFR